MLILITAIVFYFIGRYSKGEKPPIEQIVRKMKAAKIPTVISYPTREESDYEESEQEKIDNEITANLKRGGLE